MGGAWGIDTSVSLMLVKVQSMAVSASTLVSVSANSIHLLFPVGTMERLTQPMETIRSTNEQNAAIFAKISNRFDDVTEMATKEPKIDIYFRIQEQK